MHAHTVSALAILAVLASAPQAGAQSPDAELITRARAPGQAASPARVEERGTQEVDESALRYYASMRQVERVEAETLRLKRLFPSWNPPSDIYRTVEPGGADEEEFWALYALDKIAELQKAIEERKVAQPGWRPSRDLAAKVARKEMRLKIVTFAARSETEALIEYIKTTSLKPEELDLDLQWLLAETYAKAKQTQEARAIYQGVLSGSARPEERIATIQKAISALPMSQVEMLLASRPDARAEFVSIWPDVTRARISAFLKDDRADEVPSDDVAAIEKLAAASAEPGQSGLLAWYAFKRNKAPEALELFKAALEKGGDAMIAHGLAHSLLKLGMRREAEEVSYAWREPLVHNAIVFIDTLAEDLTREVPVMIENERLARYSRVVMQNESGEGAQALAWYAFNSCQYAAALPWFERAMAWHPKSATAMGYALTLQRLKQRGDVVELVNRYDGLFAELVTLVIPDDTERPPAACDPVSQAKRTTRSALPGERDQWGRVAPPQAYMSAEQQAALVRRINRKEFPIAVPPENTLRFTATGQFVADHGVRWLPEPYGGPFAKVARRVPGVGPMPYERLGFALLPGWNGVETPSVPAAAALPPPEGTLWAQHLASTGAITPSSRPPKARP